MRPASIPESMIASRDTLFVASMRIVSVVRPFDSVNVAVFSVFLIVQEPLPEGAPVIVPEQGLSEV